MAPITREVRDRARAIIEYCGAEYVGIRNDTVLFRDPESDATMSLYLKALTVTNIKLALKDAREKVLTTHEWELTNAL